MSTGGFWKQFRLCFLVIVAVLGFSTGAGSETLPSEASDQPMEIKSMKLTAKKTPTGQELVFEGKVTVTQGNLVLTCDRLVVIYDQKKKNGAGDTDRRSKNPVTDQKDPGILKSAIAYGNVKVVQNELMAVAGKGIFDNLKKTITLTDNPRLSRGKDWVTANTVVIHVSDNSMEMIGEEKNGVKATINTNPSKLEKEK